MYRAAVEWILGLRLRAGQLSLDPCIPRHWRAYRIFYRYGDTPYEILVENPDAVSRGVVALALDDELVGLEHALPLVDDGKPHRVNVTLGAPGAWQAQPPRPEAAAGARGSHA
jgi:cyclic beta-1,2-glucan synthetase